MMKEIPVQEAVGRVLFHDITRIVPGEFDGRAFKKGHIIEESDVAKLLKLGKDNIYILDLEEGFVHENESALRIAKAAIGEGIQFSEPVEGKVTMSSITRGLLKVNVAALDRINAIDEIVLATLHTNQEVLPRKQIAGTRIIPLFTEEDNIHEVEMICREHYPVITVKPFRSLKVGLVTTGNEVFHGRIEDKFGPVVRGKVEELGSTVLRQILVSDNVPMTVKAIRDLIDEGAEMIVATGGMSVDPDDRTPASIRAAGGRVVTYGSPTFPGAMFMLAYIGDVPVIGLPGCAMYRKATVFDLIVPRILAGETVTRADFTGLGHGGFCSGCIECRYPNCGFGK
ncbi:molybdopterin-binding protein [Geotalea uraniireducens]|uniref:Molybdopterin molybdenumtransferase n=2 Tax=Geotalea uraniireducens TaxID=351604 RepID=A5GB49_GEOUR|nr:molybdopterin-binding protein [Geotalea uraniireducens]ABQ25203.1 molybdenum cofactor cytidylyltransferase [Geotalea uraniireducens Rf4]